jgi:uncharacterized protein
VPDPLRPLRLNAQELLRQPGTERAVSATIAGEALGVEHDHLDGEVDVDVRLLVTNDGIVVRGEARAPARKACRRCLVELVGPSIADVEEHYQVEITDPEAFAIENHQLDLAPMVRQMILLVLDEAALCSPDCAGLCPVCGTDGNAESCDCETTVADPRWAALSEVVLDES